MKVDPFAQTLDDEFKRVAREEDIPMDALVEEVAKLTELRPRQLYNYRSGKWPIPAKIIPILSKRFRSTALLAVVRGQVHQLFLLVPDCRDIDERERDLLRLILEHHSALIARFKSEELDANDVIRLEEQTERIVQSERQLFACVEIEYERRQAGRTKQRA
jgi:hypothetical protein